jgi:hypothetical protein
MNKIGKAAPAAKQPNQGEGNTTAARAYNEQAARFAKSGKVKPQARAAQQAVDGAEGKELARAEAIGKSHSVGDDGPEQPSSLKRKHS